MDGVIFIKEVVVISLMGSCLYGVIGLVLCAMICGGIRLHINGYRDFCDAEKTVGLIISIAGLILLITLQILMNKDETIIPIFDSFGLTDHTGKYEVTVAADVDMNEFQDCYEIIDFKNGVYTIKVKEN